MLSSEVKEPKDVVFGMDDITLYSRALRYTYIACENYILEGIAQEELEYILHGLSTMICELDEKLDELMKQGYAVLQSEN